MHEIYDVYAAGSHYLFLKFDDGEWRVASVRPFLKKPGFEPLKNPAFFRQAKIDPDTGLVTWPNGICLDSDALYAWSVPVEMVSEIGKAAWLYTLKRIFKKLLFVRH